MAHVGQRAAHRLVRIGRLAGELQRQPPRLPDTDQGIVATGFAQTLDQRIGVAVSSASWYFKVNVYSIALLLGTVVSLALLAVRGAVVHDAPQGAAWLPGFFGVLQTLVMQNSPQRHSSSLYGQ
jgi:hypothetical protein